MHILVVNDDGPPSDQSSPYVHSLITTLQAAGHTVSVCLPHTQRSWIGKAHMIGQTVRPTYYRPGELYKYNGTTHSKPSAANSQEEWILVDGTPASCVQIGIYHFFQERGPIDLVVSGPNYGRNSTAVFALSSGTMGGALEASVCKKRAIAVSYAFTSRIHEPKQIASASRLSTKIIEHLAANWGDADLYSVNVPLVPDVENKKVLWTNMLQNYWGPASCFEEVEDEADSEPGKEEQKIRDGALMAQNGETAPNATSHTHKHFKWAPRFSDVYKSVEESEPGNDGWTVKEGFTSVTPLKANFMHVSSEIQGELRLSTTIESLSINNLNSLPSPLNTAISNPPGDMIASEAHENNTSMPTRAHFYAEIDYEDEYVQPLLLQALAKLPLGSYTLLNRDQIPPTPQSPHLQILQYEALATSFTSMLLNPITHIANTYIIRKALVRKHYLSTTIQSWITKNPTDVLATHFKACNEFEVDYAEFLDDALLEAWELKSSLDKNENSQPGKRDWWILKPGMSDRGQGIRLFSTMDELQAIFDEWDAGLPDSDDEEEIEKDVSADAKDYIMTSQLRHFVAQPYIANPLLLNLPNSLKPHKFHVRTYVLAVGALKVYVYSEMLALFANTPYIPPWDQELQADDIGIDLSAHLTNTCLQDGTRDGAVRLFSDLSTSQQGSDSCTSLPTGWTTSVFKQICDIAGSLFTKAAIAQPTNFQPLPNAFEVFGLDFLVDDVAEAWLLEVNAFPDFKQSGEVGGSVVEGLWEKTIDLVAAEFFGVKGEGKTDTKGELVLVGEVDLKRA